MSFKRFIARRGIPSHVYCDNGTNFRGMSVELTRAMTEMEKFKIESFANQHEITWRFNPPSAPHMGGA